MFEFVPRISTVAMRLKFLAQWNNGVSKLFFDGARTSNTSPAPQPVDHAAVFRCYLKAGFRRMTTVHLNLIQSEVKGSSIF